MFRFALLAISAFAVSACDPVALMQKLQSTDAPVISCDSYSGPGCSFDKAPLRVLPQPVVIANRPYKFFPTAERLTFVDARGRKWFAPNRTLTDGASIPRIFVSIVGDPTSPEFINAAAMHDAYCGIGNEAGAFYHGAKWQEVHKMFYDGLVVGGVNELTAKLMFAAVWLGGPRWETNRTLTHVPATRQQQAMRGAQRFIRAQNPTLGELIRYLEVQETRMLAEFPRFADSPAEMASEEPHDSYGPGDYYPGEFYPGEYYPGDYNPGGDTTGGDPAAGY